MHGHSHQQRQRATGSDLCLLTRLNTYDTMAIVAAGNLLLSNTKCGIVFSHFIALDLLHLIQAKYGSLAKENIIKH